MPQFDLRKSIEMIGLMFTGVKNEEETAASLAADTRQPKKRKKENKKIPYRAPEYSQVFFRNSFLSLKTSIKDKFRIKPMPADVLPMSNAVRNSRRRQAHLINDSD